MPRKYYIDSKLVNLFDFKEAMASRADADVHLITQQIPKVSKKKEIVEPPISAERAREIANLRKRYLTK